MNPHIEGDFVWHDFRKRFIPAAAEALAEHLGPDYVVRIDEHVYIHETDAERISFVEVRDRASWQIITVIELLSPANKRPGPDRESYIAKRSELLSGPVHFVELDLLRGGPKLPLVDLPDRDYYALVSRAQERPHAGVWPLRLRDRLPTIPIPLRAPDPDAALDLQTLIHRVYDAARYARYVYDTPPLSPADAQWASDFVRQC